MEKMRSLARARSSSRRAPPSTASYSRLAMLSTSGTDCSGLRVPSGRSCSSPLSIQSWTWATWRRAPDSATRSSRNLMTSGKLWPVSTWSNSKGTVAGAKARRASSKTTTESLPPEKRMPTLSNCPATSRRMWMDSFSRSCRCGESVLIIRVTRILSCHLQILARSGRPHRRRPERSTAHRRWTGIPAGSAGG